MIDVLRSLFRFTSSTLQSLATVLLIVSVLLNFTDVVGRYAFHAPISWASEINVFLMIGGLFICAGTVTWNGQHIRMDILIKYLPLPLQRTADFLSEFAAFAMSVLFVVVSIPLILLFIEFDQRSQAAEISMAIPQGAVPFGFAVMALMAAARMTFIAMQCQDMVGQCEGVVDTDRELPTKHD